ncbi:hypothetical protein KYC5002_33655 [Archangium violaceum]|uniref:hypothetical protein n=1 Tax=Archangium violaceum TaxID=83451 RepID=UPI002B2D4CBE|nr:hypothetical protein KYC5002_33655 [Archangium gephyra]
MPATQLQNAIGSLRFNTAYLAYSLDRARKVPYQNFSVFIPQNNTDQILIVDSNRRTIASGTNLSEVRTFATLIDSYAYRSQYGNVKGNGTWKTLYNEGLRTVYYIDHSQTLMMRSESTIPCMTCGVVLPIRLMTVDHQRPQTGGDHEAVLKTLRMLGLSKEGPKGSKGQNLQQHLSTGVALTAVPTKLNRPPAPAPAPAPGQQVSPLTNRYSLNWRGVVFYSLMIAANAETDLANNCMNGLMNLAPLCSSCNSRRGNPLKLP